MSDQPNQPQSSGWHPPEDRQPAKQGAWFTPENAISEEELAARELTAPVSDENEPAIGATPAATGLWYRPATLPEESSDTAQPEEAAAPVAEESPVDPLPVEPQQPVYLGEFDPKRSGALEGIQPDLGKFDETKSGVLLGIGAESTVASGFDPAKSSQLSGIDDAPKAAFDPTRSGQLPGIGQETPQSSFDASRSGQIPGLAGENGGSETPSVPVAPGEPQPAPESTEASEGTGALAAQENPAAQGGEAAQPVTANSPQLAQTPAPAATPPDKFTTVERNVAALRGQFQQGQITRQQLQDELRRLMILDESGRWWMLGLETDRWYRYDGQSWIPDQPPRPVTPSAIPTATGVQPVAGQSPAQAGAVASGQTPVNGQGGVQSGNTPVPARVPVQDLEATAVGMSALTLDQNRFDAPTQQGLSGIPADMGGGESANPTVPNAPVDPYNPALGGAPIEPVIAPGSPNLSMGDKTKNDELITPEDTFNKPKMDGIQPDYREAFGGTFDRANLAKWGLRFGIFGVMGFLLLAFVAVVGMLGYYFYIVNSYSDAIASLGERAGRFQTTTIYDAEGNVLAEFTSEGARESVPLTEISPYLLHATISTEDETFYENPGFSIPAILRAVYYNVITRGQGGGASTITQQLARNLVLNPEFAYQRTGNRKLQEIIVAAEIDRLYSKSEILEFYLNEIYYGNQAYGIEAASQQYFNIPARDLNIAQAAFLAGLPQSPAYYDPVVNREIAILRMNDVLRLMTEANGNGCITFEHEPYVGQAFCITQSQLEQDFVVQIAEVQGLATFTRPQYERRYPHFVNYVEQELLERYDQTFYGAGFQVYTTIDPTVQDAAQAALDRELAPGVTPNANNGSIVAIRPSDGAVIAYVGSADFFNDDIDGQVPIPFSLQQPGSSIKPFVYLTAFEGNAAGEYMYPGTVIWDVPTDFNGYVPRNYSGRFIGPDSIRPELGQSLNIPAIKALAFVGTEDFTEMLNRLRVRLPGETPVQAGLPSAIGGIDVYLFDLTSAYATLANGGVQQEPYTITRILNRDGEEIYRAPEAPPGNPVVRPQHAYLITDILADESVKLPGLSIPGWQAAAKTGTTNDIRDVWTMGYTTQLAVGVWVGRTDNQPLGGGVTSSNTTAPIWQATMIAGLQGLNPTTFPVPEGIRQYQVCDFTGAIYTPETCPGGQAVTEIAWEQQPPPPADRGFIVTIPVDPFSGLRANQFCNDFVEQRGFVNINDQSAVAWLNSAGQEWAAQHNVTLPLATPPTQECVQGQPRPQVVLTNPTAGQEVSGLTNVTGTVLVPEFESFQLQVADAATPDNFTTLSTRNAQQPGGPLDTLDFSAYPSGNYILRLTARSLQGGEVNVDVPIVINNTVVTPEPPVVPTTDPFIFPTSTPAPTFTVDPAAGGGGGFTETTPIPTDSSTQFLPPATPVDGTGTGGE